MACMTAVFVVIGNHFIITLLRCAALNSFIKQKVPRTVPVCIDAPG